MSPSPTLLLVDDEENDLALLEMAAREAQFPSRLQKCSSGAAAIAYLEGTDAFATREEFPLPAGLLLDLNMPGKNGFDVLDWVRGHQELSHITLIVLSGSDLAADVERAFDLGAHAYLVKSPSHHERVAMFRCLRDWLGMNHFPPRNRWI